MGVERLFFLGFLLIAACCHSFADPIKIGSVKTSLYKNDPHRLFVLADFGSQFGSEFAEAFQGEFSSISKDCSLEIDVSLRSALDLDENVHKTKMRVFAPDTIMLINRHGGQVDRLGNQISMIYYVKLIEEKSGNVTWEAIVNFPRDSINISLGQRGKTLAIELANDMKNSQILHSCKAGNLKP